MTCIASQLNTTVLSSLNQVFERWDVDSSGVLDKEEMSNALTDLGIQGAEAELVLRMLDTNGDGYVQYSEFLAGLLGMRLGLVEQHIDVVFAMFDSDNSGFLDKQELETLLGPQCPTPCLPPSVEKAAAKSALEDEGTLRGHLFNLLPDGATVSEMLDELDTSGNGCISRDEFRDYLLRNISVHN